MMRFPKGSIVKHKSGGIKGVVDSHFGEKDNDPWIFVMWDDGTATSHRESELSWATVDEPKFYKNIHD
ncbi:Uncharacterised protein [Serratia marcescens]|nr:Uncharacterised protein [Serratia marcescens]